MRDFAAFAQLVHEAYPHLHDRVFLQGHPLLELIVGASPVGAERLHRTLIDALEWLRPLGAALPASVEWRRYRHLQLRYVEGATPEQIARELQVSARQARRDHVEALDEIAQLLWMRLVRVGARPSLAAAPTATPAPRSATRPVGPPPADSLDAEISSLSAATATAPTRLDEVIQGVLDTVSRLAERHGVRLAVETAATLDPVGVNRTVLRQLLLNLLSDAIVHQPGAAIQITAGGQTGPVDVTITVHGVNGDEAERDANSAGGNDRGQVGLSADVLEVSRRLAQSQDAVFVDERRSGGAVFRLTLPASRATTVLLVDDNPDAALLFRRYLADTDYRLVQARSAERALRLARELRPAVVVLDVLMPTHDGWEILQALRAEPTTATLPVVICSVVPDHALAYSLGVTDFLSKPVTRPALLDLLARLARAAAAAGPGDPTGSSDTDRRRASRPVG
ncbi:MAG TPA: response regulator [Chloroflexota bacterium]|nr:response regulator [Chloroflexota bacterium]